MIRLKVKEYAEQQGLNIAQLARRADIDHRTVSRIFRNPHQEISMPVLVKLAKALNVAPADLFEVIEDN